MLSVDLATAWTPAWQSFRTKAIRSWRARVAADPGAYLSQVQQFAEALSGARRHLDRCERLSLDGRGRKRFVELETRYALLAAGLYADARPATGVQGPPAAGLVVGSVVIGLAGIAWAIAALQYALNLREQTALLEKELVARVEASREGRALPPSSIATPEGDLKRTGWMLVGALALVTAGVAVPAFLKKSA